MRSMRSFLGIVGVLAWILMAVVSTGSAQAAAAPGNGVSVDARVAPTAPHDAGTLSARAAAAVSPTIRPAVRFIHRADGEIFHCDPGNLCVEVWDPTVSKWKVFFLYTCNRYYASNWHGDGYYLNKQTGGVTSYFYGESGNVLRSFTPPQVGTQDWTPVWSVRNC